MKKIKYLILATILLIPINVKAATGSLQVNCTPTTVNPGGTVACTVKGTSEEDVGSLKMMVQLGDGLSIVNFTKNADWEGGLNDSRISLYNENQVKNTFDIGILNLKVNDSAAVGQVSIGFNDILFSNDEDPDVNIEVANKEVNITISTASAVGLKTLKPSVGTLQPQFVPADTTKTGYALTIPADAATFGFTATAENSNDTITFKNGDDETQTLDPSSITFSPSGGNSSMSIKIYVGEFVYTIIVSKDVQVDDKGYELTSLKVGSETINLTSGKYDYEVTLKDVSSYMVVATLNDPEKYEILTNLENAKTGAGSFTIITAARDSSSGLEGQTYTITVKEGSAPSSSYVPPSSSTPVNPPTGGALSIVVALILMASFGASIYFYKRNMGYFSK